MVPSRLKLYPVGITKETIFLGTPNFSIASIAEGKADSEFEVAKAIVAGSDTAFIKGRTGILNISATGSNTKPRNNIKATYRVARSLNRLYKTSSPMCPTVYAIAAKTATGA